MKKIDLDFDLKGQNMSALQDLITDKKDRHFINRLAVIWASVNTKRTTLSDFHIAFRESFPEECQRTWFDLINKKLTTKTRKWK